MASVSWQLFDLLTVFSAGFRFFSVGKRIFIKFCGLICFISASKPSDNESGVNCL